MKRLFVFAVSMMVSISSFAGYSYAGDENCFSISLDGKKISHTVKYIFADVDDHTPPTPTINVSVFNHQKETAIFGLAAQQTVIDLWKDQRTSYGSHIYPAVHEVSFSDTDSQGAKTLYEIKLDGLAQDMGGGVTILRGKSDVKVNGQVVLFPNLKTVRRCVNPTYTEEIKEIESSL